MKGGGDTFCKIYDYVSKYTTAMFPYSGAQEFILSPQMSKITFELWGASGGDVNDVVYKDKTIKSSGGKGGYIKGEITREALQEFMEKFNTDYSEARLLVYVGGKGFSQSDGTGNGAFNVGGAQYENNAGGGGASSIRIVNFDGYVPSDYICIQREKTLIVAGGGGGASIPSEEVMERGFGEDGADGCGYLESENYLYNFSYDKNQYPNCTNKDIWSQDYMITPGRNVDIQKCDSNSICGLGGYNKRDGLFANDTQYGTDGLYCMYVARGKKYSDIIYEQGCIYNDPYDFSAYGAGGGIFTGCSSISKNGYENVTFIANYFCRPTRFWIDGLLPTAGGGGGGAGGYASPYITNVSGNCGSNTGNGRVRICYTIDEPTISKTFTYRKSKYGEIAFSEQICPYKVSDPIESTDYYSLSNHKDNEGKVISNKMAIRCGKNGKWETEEVNGTEQLKYIYKCELLNKCPNPNKEEDENKVWDSVIPIVNTGVTTNLEDGTKMQCIVDEEGNANYYKLHWKKL